MNIFFDTTILVAALVDSHPKHEIAFPWLLKANSKQVESFVCTHTIAELYAVLTSLPIQRKVKPADVWQLILNSVLKSFHG